MVARSRRRIAIAVGLAIVAVWAARELPRKILRGYLSRALEARIEIGELRFEGWTKVALVEVEAGEFSRWPAVERATFEAIVVEGKWTQLLSARIERMTARGMAVRLRPGTIERRPDSPLRIGELEIEPAELEILTREGAAATALIFAGRLEQIGGDASGTLELEAPALELAPVLEVLREALLMPAPKDFKGRLTAVEGTLEIEPGKSGLGLRAQRALLGLDDRTLTLADLDATWSSTADGRQELSAAASGAVAAVGERALDLGAARLAMSAAPVAGRPGVVHVEIEPELALAADARLAGDWDRGRKRLLALDGRAREIDLGLLIGDGGIKGEVDVELATAGTELSYVVTGRPRSLDLGAMALRTERASVVLAGEVPLETLSAWQDGVAGPLELSFDLPAITGDLDAARPGERPVPPGLSPVRGSFRGELGAGVWGAVGPRASLRGTYGLATAGLGRLRAAGELRWAESTLAADLDWNWHDADLPRLAGVLEQSGILDAGLRAGLEVSGRLRGDGRLEGRVAEPRIAARLRIEDLTLADKGSSWRAVNGGLEAELRRSPDPDGIELRIGAASADLELPSLSLPLTLEARVRVEPSFRAGEVRQATLASEGLGELRFDGRFEPSGAGPPVTEGKLRAAAFDLAAWQEKLGFEVGGVRFQGRLSADLDARFDAAGGCWRLGGPATLAAAGASSADGTRVVEGLEIAGTVEAAGGSGSPMTLRATGTSDGFVALWGTFFEDFSDAAGGFELDASLPAPVSLARAAWRLAAHLDVPAGATFAGEMQASAARPGELVYALRLEAPDLAATHDRYLRPILSERLERPELAGRLRAALHGGIVRESADPNVESWLAGDVHVEAFDGAFGDQVAVRSLDVHLPVDLRFGTSAAGEGLGDERRQGRLSFKSLSFRGLELPRTQSALRTGGDEIEIEQPLVFQILGGTVTLDRLILRDLLDPGRSLRSSLSFEDLSLERIASALDFFPLEGALAGTFPRFQLSASELKVEGGGEVSVFGGRVAIRDISGKNVLTPFPTLTLSAEFEDVDLGRLTRRLDFGEMTGILRGSISNCEFFRGVPVRCAARFETVRRPGVPRTVDVKAINNLSILGTGQRVGPLDRGIHRFLDRYRYARLGVELGLDDDRLLLRGLERRRGRELFMKGRFPFPIDVVNVQPGRTVSFKTLLQRLRSIDFSSARTAPSQKPAEGVN